MLATLRLDGRADAEEYVQRADPDLITVTTTPQEQTGYDPNRTPGVLNHCVDHGTAGGSNHSRPSDVDGTQEQSKLWSFTVVCGNEREKTYSSKKKHFLGQLTNLSLFGTSDVVRACEKKVDQDMKASRRMRLWLSTAVEFLQQPESRADSAFMVPFS